MMMIIYGNCNQLTSKFQFDPHQLWDAFTFVCEGIDFAGPSVRACDIDVSYNLITAIAKYGEYAALNQGDL